MNSKKLDIQRNNFHKQTPKTIYIKNEKLYSLLLDYFTYMDTKEYKLEKNILELNEILHTMIYGILKRYRKSLTIFYWNFFTKEDKEDFVSTIKSAIYSKLNYIKKHNLIAKLDKNKVFSYFTVMIKNFIVWEYYKILKQHTEKSNFYLNFSQANQSSWLNIIEISKKPDYLKIKALNLVKKRVSDIIINKNWNRKQKEFYNAIITVLHYSVISLINYDWFEKEILRKKYKIN